VSRVLSRYFLSGMGMSLQGTRRSLRRRRVETTYTTKDKGREAIQSRSPLFGGNRLLIDNLISISIFREFLTPSGIFLLSGIVYLSPCLADSLSPESLLAVNADYSIFSESERRFLASLTPVFRTQSIKIQASVLPHSKTALGETGQSDAEPHEAEQSESEVTLREIELKRYGSESEEDFSERANSFYADLLAHPENFQEKARTNSASRSRFRSGLLTPLTVNQLDLALARQVVALESSQLTRPIRVGDSFFILRRESPKGQK